MSRKIKLVHAVSRLGMGGMENGIVNICNGLNRDLFAPAVFCLKEGGAMESRLSPDVKVKVFNYKEGCHPMRWISLMRELKKEKIDIIHAHGWGQGSFEFVIAAKAAGVPVVINGEHGLFFLKSIQVWLQRFISGLCDATLTVGNALKIETIEKLKIDPARIIAVCNGVDIDRFHGRYDNLLIKNRLAERYKIGFSGDDLIVGCLGSLKPVKNQIMVLKAAEKIKNKDLNIKFLLIGEGPDRGYLEEFIKNNGLSNDVFLLGQIDDVPEMLSLMDLIVCPSISEGFPNAILEAFSSGVPVIAARSPGTEELVIDGENGFIIEQNDAERLSGLCESLSGNRAPLKKMALKARGLIENSFSIRVMVEKYEALYSAMLRKKNIVMKG